jgi:peptide/nickel transport system permease protein
MTTYITRRLLTALLVIILVSLAVFFVMHLLPGDPLMIYMGDMDVGTMSEQRLQELRHEFGLDKPLPLQYVSWMAGIFRGNFGTSVLHREKVANLMLECYPVTVHLGILAFLVSAFMGIGVGLLAGLRRGRWIDQVTTVFAYLGVATPAFWLGILMIYVLGLKLRLLPTSGYTPPTSDFWLSTRQIIMPVICLSIAGLASTARQMRTSIIEVMHRDYIRTAWAKGLAETEIVRRHALKNSLIPVVTVIGLNIRNIFGGSVIVETVFAVPGVGRLLVSSIFGHDYVVVQSITLVLAGAIVLTNLIVDLSYGYLDPRIRYD